MRVTVTTPTGHIGSVVARQLLDAGAEVVLPVRHPEKVAGLAERGAKVMKGTLADAAFLTEACRGVDALFWVTPPDLAAPDYLAHYAALGRSAATAVKESGITQVVNLSSVGAHLKEGTGPIKGLYPIEKMLEDSRAPDETPTVRMVYEKGEHVTINEGPFEGYEGSIDELLPDKGLVRVLVTIFGRQAPIEIEEWQISKDDEG